MSIKYLILLTQPNTLYKPNSKFFNNYLLVALWARAKVRHLTFGEVVAQDCYNVLLLYILAGQISGYAFTLLREGMAVNQSEFCLLPSFPVRHSLLCVFLAILSLQIKPWLKFHFLELYKIMNSESFKSENTAFIFCLVLF